jgi:hypothetical protein
MQQQGALRCCTGKPSLPCADPWLLRARRCATATQVYRLSCALDSCHRLLLAHRIQGLAGERRAQPSTAAAAASQGASQAGKRRRVSGLQEQQENVDSNIPAPKPTSARTKAAVPQPASGGSKRGAKAAVAPTGAIEVELRAAGYAHIAGAWPAPSGPWPRAHTSWRAAFARLQVSPPLHILPRPACTGADEAGRGPLAGPVVAAACIIPSGTSIPGVADSKKLTAAQREEVYEAIMANPAVRTAT